MSGCVPHASKTRCLDHSSRGHSIQGNLGHFCGLALVDVHALNGLISCARPQSAGQAAGPEKWPLRDLRIMEMPMTAQLPCDQIVAV